MNTIKRAAFAQSIAILFLTQWMTGCGGGDSAPATTQTPPVPTFAVGGMVTGLAGTGLVLQNNASNNLSIAANGGFNFTTEVANGSAYAVTVQTQPTSPSQTCTVANGAGSINGAAIANVAVNCVVNTFAINASVSGLVGGGLVLQNNGGNDLSVASNGNIAFTSAIASGASYDVRVLVQPTAPNQRCTVTNGRGTVGNAPVNTPTIACVTQIPRFAYSVDYGSSTLSIYGVNASTGQLRPRGFVATASNPILAVSDPAQKFWFALSSADAKLSVYRHDDVTGDLVEVAGSPYATGGTASASAGPAHVAVHPSGSFVYVTNGSGTNNIAGFAINSTSGVLTPIAGSPFAAGTNPLATTIDANGAFAYVTNRGSNNIYTYNINPTSGALTEVANSRVTTGVAPGMLVLHANGRLAYVANNTDANISAFSVNPNTGLLTAVAGSPFAAGVNPASIVAIHPSGKFLYLRNANAADTAGSVSAYAINQTSGVLTAIGSPSAIGANSTRLVFDPAGKFLFVSNQGASGSNGMLSEFSINPTTGALTALTGVPVWPGRLYSVTVDPSGQYVYASNAAANILSTYSLDAASGALTPTTQGGTLIARDLPLSFAVYSSISTPTAATFGSKVAYVTQGNIAGSVGAYQVNATTGALSLLDTSTFGSMVEPIGSQVNAAGTRLYVANKNGTSLWNYNITSTGTLTSQGAGGFTTAGQSIGLTVDATEHFAYTLNSTTQNISVFGLNPSAIGAAVNTIGVPVGIAHSPNGRFVYVAGDATLGRWVVNPADGALVGGGASTVPSGTKSFAIDPTGQFAFVAGTNAIGVYTLDPVDGFAPTAPASTLTTGLAHKAMVVEPTGRFLYAANGASNTVSAFAINPLSGALTAIGSPIASGTNVVAIAADYSGKYVYAVNQGNNTVTAFSINQSTGALTAVASGSAPTGATANSISLMNVMQ